MTNRDKVNALSNREMAVLWDYIKSDCASNNCVFNDCPDCGGDCLKGFEAWLGSECEAEENPPADNEPQEAIPTEVRVDLRKVAKEIVSECKEHYPNDCEDCRYGDSIGLCCFKQEPPTWDFGTANEATPPDMVNKPAHYVKGDMECIDFIQAIVSDLTPYEAYCLGNVVKYLWRFKDKNGVIDLDKAVRYIEFLKEAQGNEVET